METTRTDKSIGVGILFVLIALAGAGAMFGAEVSTTISAAGFAIAMIAGCLAIVGLHAYDD